ncbi:glyoxylate/hydroxypyruvate reductase A [Pelomonas sp. Root1217]|uniref:2-hydroxyacid dehydrogenase n=1 Tax=Pelomonas sp. Root1217 TaxID=1736430 RepID=UPI000710ED83|nr:glyoxylate/hydroxypyruvate reductase A [Pelomonas sp. Root1217]KQV45751.1 glyoxylate/hydroxypyruvate reductase A [Pelomonas sp. Root1217]
MATFLYMADAERGRRWGELFRRDAPAVDFRLWPDVGDPAQVHYLATWQQPGQLAERFPNLKLLFSTGAGVDQFDLAALPPAVSLVRMVEPGIVQGMVEYVLHAVLDLHRDMPAYRRQQTQRQWRPLPVRTAAQCRVGVLGLGSLGEAVLHALHGLGFDCAGWSRSRRNIDDVRCFAGEAERAEFLRRSDILICLLPLTDATRGLLDSTLFDALPRGASLIHVGRGPQLVNADLLRALDDGRLGEAVLDVTDPEPLPSDDPLWRHPRVQITPHIASMTQPDTAAAVVLDNLRRFEAGLPLVGLVDRRKGY